MADEGFLQRWARRKAEARVPPKEGESTPEAVPQADAGALPDTPEPATPRSRDDADAAVDLAALPDIDGLTYDSDFTVFLRQGVPPELRRRALQRLWRSNPTLANLDGLVEYGEDYTKIGTAKQVVRTAYQVGRGMLERVRPPAEEAQAPASSAAAEHAGRQPVTPDHGDPDAAAAGLPPPAGGAQEVSVGSADQQGEAAPTRPDPEGSGIPKKPRPLPRRG